MQKRTWQESWDPPPVKEQKALALRQETYELSKDIKRISANNSQDPRLAKYKSDRDLREKELLSSLGADNITPLKECLIDLKSTENEWCERCYVVLKVASDHLEAPLCAAVQRARQGKLSSPEERKMQSVVFFYSQREKARNGRKHRGHRLFYE